MCLYTGVLEYWWQSGSKKQKNIIPLGNDEIRKKYNLFFTTYSLVAESTK
jgi:hypothetical protein